MDTDPAQQPPDNDPEGHEDDEGRTPPPDDLDQDPAYNPDDEGVKDIKGG